MENLNQSQGSINRNSQNSTGQQPRQAVQSQDLNQSYLSQNRGTQMVKRFQSSQTQRRIFHGGSTQNASVLQSPVLRVGEEQSVISSEERNYLWGTNINTETIEKDFGRFLAEFRINQSEDMEIDGENCYWDQIKQIRETEHYSFNIDADHIFQFDKTLYYQLVTFPAEIIPIFDNVANRAFAKITRDATGEEPTRQIYIGVFNLKKLNKMRELNPKDINKLVQIKGIVIRCSDIMPEMKDAVFRCTNCGRYQESFLERGKIQEPLDCSACKVKYSYELIHNLCLYMDKQYIKLQETPETVPDGETPQTITLIAYDDNVDTVKPGDRIDLIGIYRAQGSRISQYQRRLKSIFKTYIDVVTYNKANVERFSFESADNKVEDGQQFNEETVSKLMNLSNDEHIYEKLVQAFAPSIFENDDVKKGIMCQLFGGTQKDFSQSGKGRFRSEINILLVGDPSTAKSQLLQYVHKIAPRGIYTSGKGSSAVGLTAYVTKDPETKEIILESGALVLSDKGICCIDEFDKMDQNTQTILHEAMEQQTISVAKAGIVCQLNSRTAVLASANPVDSKYNPRRSVIENIKLPPSLLSRFDLIYLMLDKANDQHNKKLAEHILALYTPAYARKELQQNQGGIDRTTLAQYITYARTKIQPKISEEAVKDLVQGYCDMRKMGNSRNMITATPRQLESIIRIAEGLAKMRLSGTVQRSDVQEAIRLMKVATQQAATDPTTGLIDMEAINTGISFGSRQKKEQIIQHVKEFLMANRDQYENKRGITYSNLRAEIEKKFDVPTTGSNIAFQELEFKDSLKLLMEEGQINVTNFNHQNPIIRINNLSA